MTCSKLMFAWGVCLLGAAGVANAIGLPSGTLGLSEPNNTYAQVQGAAVGDRLGEGLAGGGDLNGDGYPDLAIAAPGAGKIYVILGGGFSAPAGASSVATVADLTFLAQATSAEGEHYALAFTDLDNDTYDDLIIGTPYYDGNGFTDAGRVYVVYGRREWDEGDFDLLAATSDDDVLTVTSSVASANLGYSVSGGADAGGSGSTNYDDLLIGSPGNDRAYIIWGRSTARSALNGIKAVTGLVGGATTGTTFTDSGAAAALLGRAAFLTPALKDGESRASVMLGAPGQSSTDPSPDPGCGAVYVFYPTASTTVDTANANVTYNATCNNGSDPFGTGTSVHAAFINADAYGELLFGGPTTDTNETGRVFLRFGSSSGPATTALGTGAGAKPYLAGTTNEKLGYALGSGMVDLDAKADIIVGSPNASSGYFNSTGGQIYVILSTDITLSAATGATLNSAGEFTAAFLGEAAGDRAGAFVSSYTSPFASDYGVIAMASPSASSRRGKVYLFVPNDDVDQDGDGATIRSGDCDESDPTIRPGKPEACDTMDNDCDGKIDEGVSQTYYLDSDSDGYGLTSESTSACFVPPGYAPLSGDCDDGNDSVHPNGTELCNSTDEDCDSKIDEGVTSTFYTDADSDGFGDAAHPVTSCSTTPGTGQSANSTDCNDANAAINPNTQWYIDYDQDTYGDGTRAPLKQCTKPTGYVLLSTDCDDLDDTVHPGATELCDGKDNACSGSIPTNEVDNDGDGWVECNAGRTCAAGSGASCVDCDDAKSGVNPAATEVICNGVDEDCTTGTADAPNGDGDTYDACAPSDPGTDDGKAKDCNDGNRNINPGATEVCDGGDVDENCNGTSDEGFDTDADTFYQCAHGGKPADCDDTRAARYPGNSEICDGLDNDCDLTVPLDEQDVDDDGQKTCSGDCDDGDPDRYLGLTETCDDKDNDCDLTTDEGFDEDEDTWYTCARASLGHAADCDDAAATTHPDAPELCDGIDNDCDDSVEDEQLDEDGDTFPACRAGNQVDCQDGDPAIHPEAPEICNQLDDDCDEDVDDDDDGVTQQPTWYPDADADGTRASTGAVVTCVQPDGYLPDTAEVDCDDGDDEASPLLDEVCDEKDNDCDTDTDEGVQDTYWADEDEDGFGDPQSPMAACEEPLGYTDNDGDCDDADAERSPNLVEYCDGKDNNCNLVADEGFDADGIGGSDCVDGDGDGTSENLGDCNDEDATIYPGAGDTTDDDVDDDCDGVLDEDASDLDQDGYSTSQGDCDDADADAFPGGSEVDHCDDGADNDCNGIVDDHCDGQVHNYGDCSTSPASGALGGWVGALLLLAPIALRRRPRR